VCLWVYLPRGTLLPRCDVSLSTGRCLVSALKVPEPPPPSPFPALFQIPEESRGHRLPKGQLLDSTPPVPTISDRPRGRSSPPITLRACVRLIFSCHNISCESMSCAFPLFRKADPLVESPPQFLPPRYMIPDEPSNRARLAACPQLPFHQPDRVDRLPSSERPPPSPIRTFCPPFISPVFATRLTGAFLIS